MFGREKMEEGKEHLTDVSHISREKEQVEFTNQPPFFPNTLWELTAAGVADENEKTGGPASKTDLKKMYSGRIKF